MTAGHDEFDPRLLDYHLGNLSDEQRQALHEQLRGDARLAAQHDALASVFAALGQLPRALPPADLGARICERVRSLGRPPRVLRRTTTARLIEEHQEPAILRLYSFRDVAAVAAVIVLAVGLGVPGVLHMRDRSERLACSYNLARLGAGMQAYSLANAGSLPFVGWSPRHSWQPSDDADVQVVPNRRHLYPLLSLSHVRTEWFICPASRDVAMPQSEIARHDDFLESRNVSYANQNMAGVRPSSAGSPALPILGDDNPLFDNGIPLGELAAATLGLRDPARINSRAHRGAGQNVLTFDGHVQWMTTPFSSRNGDNIWTIQGVDRYTGHEGPASADDAQLLK